MLVICRRGKWKLSPISKCLDSSSVVISVEPAVFPLKTARVRCSLLTETEKPNQPLCSTHTGCLSSRSTHLTSWQLWAVHHHKRPVTIQLLDALVEHINGCNFLNLMSAEDYVLLPKLPFPWILLIKFGTTLYCIETILSMLDIWAVIGVTQTLIPVIYLQLCNEIAIR